MNRRAERLETETSRLQSKAEWLGCHIDRIRAIAIKRARILWNLSEWALNEKLGARDRIYNQVWELLQQLETITVDVRGIHLFRGRLQQSAPVVVDDSALSPIF